MNLILIIIITLLLSAFFSGMEIAFFSSNKLRIELDKKHGTFGSGIISTFTSNPGKYITTMLIGNNIALVIYGIFMAILLEPFILNFTNSDAAMLILQTILSTLIILVVAEFLPKAVVMLNPNGALSFFAVPIFFFYVLFYPVSQFISWLSTMFLKGIFKTDPSNQQKARIFGALDLNFLIKESQEEPDEKEAENNEMKLFQNALSFSNVKLRDCLVPRAEIVALEKNSSVEELKQKFIETGYSKILIYNESIDNILGYATSKSLFKNPKNIASQLISVSFVPETMPANKLLREFIQEQKNLAVVVDEFGGIAGMVTIEDLIEEIIGEIIDEHDSIDLIEKCTGENEYIFSGRMEIDYLNEHYGLNLPESNEYETLAGLIYYLHESIPKINARIRYNNFEFKILKVSKTKIDLVAVRKEL